MKTFRWLFVVVLLMIMGFGYRPARVVSAAAGATLYVAPGAPASGSCTRSAPCDFRYAVELVANDGDVIYAHSGFYTAPTVGSQHLLYIYKSLTIYGSCTFDASTPVTCDFDARDSYLNGENDKRVISIQGLGTQVVHIEGFTIYQGDATGVGAGTCDTFYVSSPGGCGGGIFAENLYKLTLKNNYIWSNTGGSPRGLGGGLYAEDVDHLIVQDNTFISNIATDSGRGMGGAAFVVGSGGPHAVVFENNLITGNELSMDDSTGFGAGVMAAESNNVQFTRNRFSYQNAIYAQLMRGTSIFIGDTTGFSMQGNDFHDDWGISVVHLNGLEGAVTNGWITQNTFFDNLVNINLDIHGPVMVDIVNNFLGRQMIVRGGQSANIYLVGSSMSGNNDVDVYFNTLAAADFGIQVDHDSELSVFGNIFTELSIEAIDLYSAVDVTTSIDTNLFFHNTSNGAAGANPIYADPLLADPVNGDFHLLPGSGAIDRAAVIDFDVDIDGDPRPVGAGPTPYDLGADEFCFRVTLPLALK